jgi:predicted Fe-Mo cluster-binding NifX family protein
MGIRMKKAAFATWENRVAPVFDVAREVRLVEADGGRIVRESRKLLPGDLPGEKALRLAELGVDTLVCGGISRGILAIVTGYGIRVIPFIAGDLRQVIEAWLGGTLNGNEFAMPGCWRRGRRPFSGAPGTFEEERFMNGKGGRGMGRGGGQGRGGGRGQGPGGGQGGGRRRAGRMGGPKAGGPGGSCVCPQCGHKEPHERGIPCAQKKCPKCGVAMTRE